jgi:hypothetical protein
LFWKNSDKLNDDFQKLFSVPSEARDAFRVNPSPDLPLKATLNAKTVVIINISSGGFCCTKTDLEVGKNYLAEVVLPPEDKTISASVTILQNDHDHHCRCQFQDLDPEYEDSIHLYVLNRQKEEQDK